jgi:hypothetical protein
VVHLYVECNVETRVSPGTSSTTTTSSLEMLVESERACIFRRDPRSRACHTWDSCNGYSVLRLLDIESRGPSLLWGFVYNRANRSALECAKQYTIANICWPDPFFFDTDSGCGRDQLGP